MGITGTHALKPSVVAAGILLYSAGIFCFTVNDALGKWLMADYSASQLMFLRAIGASAILAIIMVRSRTSLLPDGQYGLHVLRIVCSAADTFAFYYSSRSLPLADVMTFYMAAPLVIVALSAIMLGERVGSARWAAVVCGFVGVVIALRPGQAALSMSSLLALTGAVLFALTMIITRRLRATNWLALTSYQVVGTGLLGAATSALAWTTPNAFDLGLMLVVGIVSMGCFMSLTKALSLAPASLLAPFQYASIVWAVLIGWAVWGDVPTATTLVGVAVIVASGVYAIRGRPLAA